MNGKSKSRVFIMLNLQKAYTIKYFLNQINTKLNKIYKYVRKHGLSIINF